MNNARARSLGPDLGRTSDSSSRSLCFLRAMLAYTVTSLSLTLGIQRQGLKQPRAHVRLTEADLFTKDSWKTLQLELDTLPVFTIVNEDGAPLQGERNGSPSTAFFADVAEAESELSAVKELFPDMDLDITPAGLGSAFKAQVENTAVLVPSSADMQAAGLGENPEFSASFPLYTCMELESVRLDGKGTCVPVFVAMADAKAAVAEATEAMKPEQPLEIGCITLDKAIEETCADQGANFRFVASSASVRAIRQASGL